MRPGFIFVLLTVFFSGACTQKTKLADSSTKSLVPVVKDTIFKVEGMSCEHCEMSITKGVLELTGIDSVKANHLDSTAFVRFDSSQTTPDEIIAAIEKRGYTVVR